MRYRFYRDKADMEPINNIVTISVIINSSSDMIYVRPGNFSQTMLKQYQVL